MDITAEILYQLYKTLSDTEILFSYTGPISQNLLIDISESLKRNTSLGNKSRKIFPLFVELAQNIERYSVERTYLEGYRETGIGILVLYETAESYILVSGNQVDKNKADFLGAKIEHIKSLTVPELESLYRAELRTEHTSGRGAGVGLIDIARRSGSEFNYEFKPIDDEYSFFIITVKITKET